MPGFPFAVAGGWVGIETLPSFAAPHGEAPVVLVFLARCLLCEGQGSLFAE